MVIVEIIFAHHVTVHGVKTVLQSTDSLQQFSMFQNLNDDELRKLKSITFNRHYSKRSNVFVQGQAREGIYFIKRGVIKIYKVNEDGAEQVIFYLHEGDLFPHAGFFENTPYPATAEVAEEAELIFIPTGDFEQLLLAHPSIAIAVMKNMSQKIEHLQRKVQEFIAMDVNRRIISILVRLVEEHGQRTDCENKETIHLKLPITHQDIANMAGTSRETVNRLFNQLKKQEILRMNRREIIIDQIDALKEKLYPA